MHPVNDDDGMPLFVHGSDTSQEAAESIAKDTGRLRLLVLEEIRDCGGATCDELEVRLNLTHQTCSPRVVELRDRGQIRDSGMRRKTRGGRFAVVWVSGNVSRCSAMQGKG